MEKQMMKLVGKAIDSEYVSLVDDRQKLTIFAASVNLFNAERLSEGLTKIRNCLQKEIPKVAILQQKDFYQEHNPAYIVLGYLSLTADELMMTIRLFPNSLSMREAMLKGGQHLLYVKDRAYTLVETAAEQEELRRLTEKFWNIMGV